jgi:uncharacterized membrane protein
LQFRRDEGGNMAILFAFAMVLATMFGAFAVDEGALYLQRRQAQSAVDLASIAAATNTAGAFATARQSLTDAGLIDPKLTDAQLKANANSVQLTVETGVYTPDPTLSVGARFRAGAAPANAVHVGFRTPGALYFAQSWSTSPPIGVDAVASATPTVTFSVGSSLAQLQGGIPNAILNALLGADISLSAVSYNSLLSTKVSIFGFLDALAQELGITVGTYQDVLNASANQGVIAKAIADTLTGADRSAALTLAAALGHNGKVPIAKLFGLGDAAQLDLGTGAASGYLATVSALELLSATGALSDGTHQVDLNLAAGVPGLTSLTMSLAVGEPAQFATWFAMGPGNTVVRTAQVRLRFLAVIAGGPALLNAGVQVPLYLTLAYAEAKVQSATCPGPADQTGTAVIATQPGVAQLTLGNVGDPAFGNFGGAPTITPATLINLILLQVTGSAQANIGQTVPVPLSFSASDITGGVVKRATTSTFTQSLMTSLLGNLSLNVNVLGIGLPSVSAVSAATAKLVAPLGPVLDAAITSSLGALGLTLGDADVEVYGVHCTRAVLVR